MAEVVSSSVKTPLIPNQHRIHEYDAETSQLGFCRGDVIEEAKKQLWQAGPLIAVSLLQYSLQITSVMYVGHLGELALSGASLASSFASVTGFSVLLGMGSALETLCGQAYGAKLYHMLGVHMQRGMLTLLAVCIPLELIWFYTSTILIALGQDHEISTEAGTFNRWMMPSLFGYSLLQCLNRFLQSQNNVFPMMISSGITAVLHIIVCWALCFKFGLGSKGAAFAISISNWVNVLLLASYVMFSPVCKNTWTGFSKEALHDILSFIKLAIPSATMICFEYWTFEMVVLLSGLLPNPKLETSVLSISLSTCWMVYMISVGLGSAIKLVMHAICTSGDFSSHFSSVPSKFNLLTTTLCYHNSTRVSNELGAGRPQGAQLALQVMITMALSEGAAIAIATVLVRGVWGKLYSNEKEVIRYVAEMMPLLALSNFLDGFQCVLSGAARGCGWQNLCVYINLGAYYVVGIPTAVLFAFILHIGGMGLWMGIICALLVQVTALVAVNARTDWHQEATKAAHRVQNTSLGQGNIT